jgi:hypothetical protein
MFSIIREEAEGGAGSANGLVSDEEEAEGLAMDGRGISGSEGRGSVEG